MTKDEIRAELRRSACEDEYPFFRLEYPALAVVQRWLEQMELVHRMRNDDVRTLFLLVAKAME